MGDESERIRAELKRHGDRRRAAREADREELEAIAKLLAPAVQAGITKREIAELTGVSRPWIDALMQRPHGN